MIIQAAHRLPKEIRRLQMASKKTIKSAIESMMFVWGKPLDIKDVADVFNIDKKEIYEYFKELQEEYEQEGRGIVIREVNKRKSGSDDGEMVDRRNGEKVKKKKKISYPYLFAEYHCSVKPHNIVVFNGAESGNL